MKYMIAVDGGGTKTLAVLLNENGDVLGKQKTGPSNPNDIGREASAGLLCGLCRNLSCGYEVSAVFAGISGATGNSDFLAQALAAVFPRARISVGPDVSNLFALLPSGGDGSAVLICGTGSVCFAKKNGELHRIGGWGWLLDSWGGGYSVGRAGMEAALSYCDGRGKAADLYGYAREYLGERPEDAVPRIYREGKPFIAGFAGYVCKAAENGGSDAGKIVSEAAESLAEYLTAAGEWLGNPGFRCICSGGLFYEKAFDCAFTYALKKNGIRADVSFAQYSQITGAAAAACRLAGTEPDDVFLSKVEAQI